MTQRSVQCKLKESILSLSKQNYFYKNIIRQLFLQANVTTDKTSGRFLSHITELWYITRPDSSLRYRRYISHLLTYLLMTFASQSFTVNYNFDRSYAWQTDRQTMQKLGHRIYTVFRKKASPYVFFYKF